MNSELQRAMFQASQAAEDPVIFWAEVFATTAGFAQEHIGSKITATLLQSLADSVAEDYLTEESH